MCCLSWDGELFGERDDAEESLAKAREREWPVKLGRVTAIEDAPVFPEPTICGCRAFTELSDAFNRVLTNEGNHYDRYWTPPPEPLTDEWLDETEAKMRDALTDAFCDDAAAIMLTLIAEIRLNRGPRV